MKLSEHQAWLLNNLARGRNVHVTLMRGRDTHAFLSQPKGRPLTVKVSTVFALLNRGLIEDRSDEKMRWRNSDYYITKAGREALKEHYK